MLILYNTNGPATSEYMYNVTQGKPSVLHNKIPVFYALKYPKFTTITFYLPLQRPNPHIA